MSKQDSQFFNIFSAVIAMLVTIMFVIWGIARAVGANRQGQQVLTDPVYLAEVAARIKPPVGIAVAGQDNSALKIEAPSAGAAPSAPKLETPEQVYDAACSTCHAQGIGGAPKVGDRAAWAPRLAQGNATLYKHALEGFTGSAGVMPAKGGRVDLSDDLIKATVDFLAGKAR
ncbi:MAG: c-type cytochrome [Steroidobacteraceae bacterium]